jgi:hypothetical protein
MVICRRALPPDFLLAASIASMRASASSTSLLLVVVLAAGDLSPLAYRTDSRCCGGHLHCVHGEQDVCEGHNNRHSNALYGASVLMTCRLQAVGQ